MTDLTPPAPSAPAAAASPDPGAHGQGRARHAAGPSASVMRRRWLVLGGAVLVVAAVVVVIVLWLRAGGGKNGFNAANPGQSGTVAETNARALRQIRTYNSAAQSCGSRIACIESADRTLAAELHLYANYVGTLKQTAGTATVLSNALNTSQVTANIFEILGDAQPTRANYTHVLHSFNVTEQLDKMTNAINELGAASSG